jgi:hypothetical protein
MALAKLKALLRKAAVRTVHGLWRRLGSLIQTFSPQESANFSGMQVMLQPDRNLL